MQSFQSLLSTADILGNYRKIIRTNKTRVKRLSKQHQLINESEVGKVY
jgi:hypothetical protein